MTKHWRLTNAEHQEILTTSGICGRGGMPQLGRAVAYLQGDYGLDDTKSPKTWRFENNIEFPLTSRFVTVDSHICRLAHGIYHRGGTYQMGIKTYLQIEKWIQELADAHGMMPHEMQALLWLIGKDVLDGVLGTDLPDAEWFEVFMDEKYGGTYNTIGIELELSDIYMSRFNLEALLDYVTPEYVALAKRWYPDAHDRIEYLSQRHGIKAEHIRRVTSIISPMRWWKLTDGTLKNIDDAVTLILLVNQYRMKVEYK